ncbi:hypothetical protein [Marinobacterium sediminicola]|uniref:Uncharacterized protein n=1 Tax=Marinobacterium sediminicola TaxID=518898 RepID=A0ABY1S213_9GAMM|nr:hypothetical protein [Marinobacterium sediminicola]ULG68547.1 hypothetical protein LN244_12690 [Marinobacterium sediminicola]SMR76587.1 hypothetical protein SAMN04487964_1125 [Marinobacterium sediminicola]
MTESKKLSDVMQLMKGFSVITLIIGSFIYFLDASDEKVINYLEKEGYTNIELGFYRPFSCEKGEPNRDSFKARDNKGREITGVVCSSAGGGDFRVILDD